MADKDYVDESFLYLLEKYAEELEAAGGKNQNCRIDEVEHAYPETGHHGIQVNSSIESDGNFLTSSFSRETRVASTLETPLNFHCYGFNFGTSTSNALAGAQQSNSEATEENPVNSFLVPVVASRGDFCKTDDSQSNPSKHSSSQHNIGLSNRGKVSWKRFRHASFGSYESTCRKKENKRAELFPQRKRNPVVSALPPQTSIERDGNETVVQTKEDYREVRIPSSIFPQIDDISNIAEATDSVSLGSVAGAEAKAVSAGGASGIETRSDQTGKDIPFKCGICGKTFDRKDHLRRHENTHTGNKSVLCPTCGRGFAQRSHLVSHLLVHSDERPHKCTECPKRFRQKAHLVAHLRTHTKEKPFACDMCGKKLAQKSNLRTHIRDHTGQEPHQCEVCRRDFAIKTNCIEHQRTEHGWK